MSTLQHDDRAWFDRLGILASSLCALHCVLLALHVWSFRSRHGCQDGERV